MLIHRFKNADQIAAHIAMGGFKGARNVRGQEYSALDKYLRARFPTATDTFINNSAATIYWPTRRRWAYDYDGTRRLQYYVDLFHTPAIREFIDGLYRGKYPDLLDDDALADLARDEAERLAGDWIPF